MVLAVVAESLNSPSPSTTTSRLLSEDHRNLIAHRGAEFHGPVQSYTREKKHSKIQA
jgi:hypothetical protein